MSFGSLGEINWLAILVGGLLYFALGGLWYSPAGFGNAWMRSIGMTTPEEGQRPGAAIYATPLISDLIAAVATGWLAEATASTTLSEGLLPGLVVSVGYTMTLTATGATFSQLPEPLTWFWITAVYNLLGLTIVAIVVSVWR